MELCTKNLTVGTKARELFDYDTLHLGKIFPIEIWKMVTAKFYYHENLSNSSPFFHKLLAPQRTLYLYQSVLALLMSTLWTNKGQHALALNDVLNCRQVCKLWNVVIDKLISDTFHIAGGTSTIKEIIQKNISYNFFYDADFRQNNLLKFLDHFEVTHSGHPEKRNPFLHQKLAVSTPDSNEYGDEHEEELQRFTEQISTLLQRYGLHVADFTLDIDNELMDLDFVTRLHEWLVHMPNLKRLTINNRSEYLEDEVPELEAFLLTTPLPSLKYLKYLDIDHLKAPLFNNLIQRNNIISTLHVNEGEEEYDFFSCPLPNLKTLKFKLATDTLDIIDKLSSPNVEWPLTSLSISFLTVYDFSRWSEFFQLIQTKFGKALVSFSLEFPEACSERWSKPWWDCEESLQLYLPSLNEVYLSTWTPIHLDFLLTMKDNLKVIFVRARYVLPKGPEATRKSVLQFYGFESKDKILDSNIWQIFTNLEKVGIRQGCSGTTWFNRESLAKRIT